MAGIFGGGGKSTTAERLGDLKMSTSSYGHCIPVVYGKARVAVNLIYYANFKSTPHTEKVGKGGGGGTTNTTYTYNADVMLAICEGPVQIGVIWTDKTATPPRLAHKLGLTFKPGDPSQTPWTALPSSKRVGYGSTAYVAKAQMDLGDNAAIPNYSFEVTGFFSGATPAGDANAADVLLDMLTHPIHGMGFPLASLSSLDDYRLYTSEVGFFVSAALETQKQGIEVIKTLLDCTNSMAVWSGGKLRILPLGDLPVGGWNPNSTPLYALTHDDFLSGGPGDDPVQVTRKSAADTHNSVKVKYCDRAPKPTVVEVQVQSAGLGRPNITPIFEDIPAYADAVAEANDLAMQDLYGLRPASDYSADFIADPNAAQTLAQTMLQRSVGIRNEYKFRLGWRYTLLEPGDLVTLTEAGLGLDNTPVRVTAVEEDAEGDLSITAEDWPNGIATAVAYPPPDTGADPVNMLAPPPFVNAPVIFEPPADLTDGEMQVWIGASGVDGSNWGGCEIWAATSAGGTYQLMGRIDAPARHGVRYQSSSAAGGSAVDMSVSGGALTIGSVSATDLAALKTLCLSATADGATYELWRYTAVSQPSANRYSVSSTASHRGLFGTTAQAWPIDSIFMFLDNAVARLDFSRWQKGAIYLKFPSFNAFGLQRQSLADIDPVLFTLTGAGLVKWKAPTAVTMTITPNLPPA